MLGIKVSLDNAACLEPTPFVCGTEGFKKFGMGFATVSAASTEDRLFIGNSLDEVLAVLDVDTGEVTVVGELPESRGEFTGNKDGELWGFFPYESPPAVLYLDKNNASTIRRLDMSQLTPIGAATSAAWAFAFWGGDFFLFYEVEPPDSSTNVYKLEPEGQFGIYIPNTGLRIVGAGVSTCAPVIVR